MSGKVYNTQSQAQRNVELQICQATFVAIVNKQHYICARSFDLQVYNNCYRMEPKSNCCMTSVQIL